MEMGNQNLKQPLLVDDQIKEVGNIEPTYQKEYAIQEHVKHSYQQTNKLKYNSKPKESILSQQYSIQQEGQNYDSPGFITQVKLLIYKNIILTFKNPKNLIFLIITPFLLSAFLYLFQDLARENGKRIKTDAPQYKLNAFPRCYGQGCVSLDYRMFSNSIGSQPPQWVKYTIEYIKLQTGFGDSDITTGTNIVNLQDFRGYHEAKDNNKTQIGVLFCDGSSKDYFINFLYCNGTNDYTYFLMINKTDSLSVIFHDYLQSIPIDVVSANLKLLIDNAILSFIKNSNINERVKEIYYSHTSFPIGQNNYINNYDIITVIGAFYFLITPLFAFLFIQNQIVRQKQYKLRQGLNIFGASHFAYWFSWVFVSNVYAIIVSVSTYLAGLSFGFGFFTETPFYIIIFFLMYPFTLSMQTFAYFISAIAPTLKASNTASYAIMLFAIVIQSFVSDNMLLSFLFTEDASDLVIFLRYFFCLYPPFSYTKIFTNITTYSGFHFSFIQRRWVQSPIKYDMDAFTQNKTDILPFGGGNFYRYSDLISVIILFGNCVFYLILTWYFDHIVSSNRGRGQPFYFPITYIINKIRGKKPKKHIVSQQIKQQNRFRSVSNSFSFEEQQEQSATQQKFRVLKNSKEGKPAFGLRIKNLSKTFQKLFSKHKVEALKKFTLQVQANELMGILGHNGAGKTTLINILTGVITPDDKDDLELIVGNIPITSMNEIRKHIGVCSQFDILWNQLTAQEHLYMFARLKGIPVDLIDGRIDQMLNFVSLSKQKKNKVASFSGGMKRRLSLAIAAIGNPKIILLDQPTTGLDPKVRQQVWKLIQKLKKGKSIILTTHSMQQADILADRVCVIVKGKMKCVGTTFYLKKAYGDGHRININLKNRYNWQQTVQKIQKMFPNIKLIDCRGGSLILGVSQYQDLLNLVKKLQSKQSHGLDEYQLKNRVRAWGVSHSTLQQVFMKVSKQKQE